MQQSSDYQIIRCKRSTSTIGKIGRLEMPTLDIFKKDVKSAKQKRKEDAMKEAVKQANREWVRKESEAMVVKAIVEREKAKAKIETQRRTREKVYQDAREKTTKR